MTKKHNLRIIYFDTNEKQGLLIVLLTLVAVLSMKEQVVNVPEPLQMPTAPPARSKMKERPKKETEELQIYKKYMSTQYEMIHMKEER